MKTFKNISVIMILLSLVIVSCEKENLTENEIISTKIAPIYGQQCGYIAYNYLWDECQELALEITGVDNLYELRDEFLAESQRGVNYIEYYYDLSDYTMDNNLLNDCIDLGEYYMLLYYGIEISINIINSNYNGVLINNEVYATCNTILDKYRNTKNANKIISILDILESDLNALHNKSANEVRAYFN